jgi:hypothetical protein
MAAVLAALSLPAAAAEEEDYLLETAGDLADLCDEPENASAIHMCQGYIVGVHQMHAAISASLGVSVYCFPENAAVSRNAVMADFSAWVKAHPDMADLSAREGLLTWARQTYPCN